MSLTTSLASHASTSLNRSSRVLHRNAAESRPPGEERELALQTLRREPTLPLASIVKHGLLRPLADAGYVIVWDGGAEPRPPR